MINKPLLEYEIVAERIDSHGGRATCKNAEIAMDTDPGGRADAFNPAELLLAAVAACMLKGIERITPMLKFKLDGVRVRVPAIVGPRRCSCSRACESRLALTH